MKTARIYVFGLILAAYVFPANNALGENPHFKRGREWLELKNYQNARVEFQQVIIEEPKNAEARVLIAQACLLENDLTAALIATRSVQQIEPNNSHVGELRNQIRTKAHSLLATYDSQQKMALSVLQELADKSSVPALKQALGVSSEAIAQVAETILRKVDAGEARAGLVALLKDGNDEVKERAATHLWNVDKDRRGGDYLLREYRPVFTTPNSGTNQYQYTDDAIRDVAIKLRGFDYELTSSIYRYVVDNLWSINSTAGWFSLKSMIDNKDTNSIPNLTYAILQVPDGSRDLLTRATEALLNLGEKDPAIWMLKRMFAASDTDEVRNLLISADSKDWADTQTGTDQILNGIDKLRGAVWRLSSKNPIDEESPNQNKVKAFVKALGPVDSFGATKYTLCDDTQYFPNPKQMEIRFNISYKNSQTVGSGKLLLRATGEPKRAWVITDVVELRGLEIPGVPMEKVVEQTAAQWAKWYRKPAESGHSPSQTHLGYLYEIGSGVKQDYFEAVKWYQKAAALGNPTAYLYLGESYANGRGIQKDEAEAVKWYLKAMDGGTTRAAIGARNRLGKMYEMGQGVAKDGVQAVKLYRESAEAGDLIGCYQLASAYTYGIGVEKDESLAIQWYSVAAKEWHGKDMTAADLAAENAFAWILATSPIGKLHDGAGAVSLAQRAVDGTNRKNPLYLGTLAAAYAENDDFRNAIKTQVEAIALVTDENAKQELKDRLRLYEAEKPYRRKP